MPEAVIVATGRTAIGRAEKGSLINVQPADMLAFVLKKVVEKSGINPTDIVDVVVGSANGANGNIARQAALLAGFGETVPGTTVNRFCSSSLQATRMVFHAIKSGEGDTYAVGGVERLTRGGGGGGAGGGMRAGGGGGDAIQMETNATLARDATRTMGTPMGITAENVAERFNVPRDRQDKFSQQSQERAVAAQKNGIFAREIIPYPKADGTVVDTDDGPRANSTLEALSALKAAFKEGGTVTAGNACPLNDGAAALVVMSDEKAKALGIKPLARIVASAVSSLDPAIMGVAPIEAVRKVLAQAKMTIGDIDFVELNEAFAAQVLPVCDEIGVDPFSEKVNPHGGAIALGHPYGMTGARIMTTLINDLQTHDKTYGIETMCVAGGQGMAMIVERLS